MNSPYPEVIEEMKRQSLRCQTIAADKTQEALVGASSEKEKNELDAKEWILKSIVWIEAETVVREMADSSISPVLP
jgi:hypothetical protein